MARFFAVLQWHGNITCFCINVLCHPSFKQYVNFQIQYGSSQFHPQLHILVWNICTWVLEVSILSFEPSVYPPRPLQQHCTTVCIYHLTNCNNSHHHKRSLSNRLQHLNTRWHCFGIWTNDDCFPCEDNLFTQPLNPTFVWVLRR